MKQESVWGKSIDWLAENVDSESLTRESYLIQKVREGDKRSITELIDLHRKTVIRTAHQILRDTYEAEDVAQEAFIRAFSNVNKLREDGSFKRYIHQITVRLCIDYLRKRRCKTVDSLEVESRQYEDLDTKFAIERVLSRLSPDLRTTLILREVQQLDYSEIALILDVPVGTVRSRLHTAREKFRQLWVDRGN
jgi:RNA polymerase sigma-70 factor, ECF subfamily